LCSLEKEREKEKKREKKEKKRDERERERDRGIRRAMLSVIELRFIVMPIRLAIVRSRTRGE